MNTQATTACLGGKNGLLDAVLLPSNRLSLVARQHGRYFAHVIEQTTIEDILSRIDLQVYVGEYVALTERGERHVGLCPFHKEKTPSFMVYADHYHCHGCGAHGNAIRFVMDHGGLSFMDAMRSLSSMTGVPLNTAPAPVRRPRHIEDTLRRVAGLYERELHRPGGQNARDALATRGIDPDVTLRFGIGYAPNSLSVLNESVDASLLDMAGLTVSGRNGEPRPRFRNRLMLPIHDTDGSVIGFGGRTLSEDDPPKYLNSAESPVYQKRRVLYGLHQALPAIRQSRQVIVCEGYFDVISPAQHDILNIVATCGTALTGEQLELLASVADDIVFCFDDDPAGHKASKDAAHLSLQLLSDYQQARICILPDGHDPDSLVRNAGADQLLRCIGEALPASTFLIETLAKTTESSERSARSLLSGLGVYQAICAPATRLFFLQALCDRFSITQEAAMQLMPASTQRASLPDTQYLRPCPCCGAAAKILPSAGGLSVQCTYGCVSTSVQPSEAACLQLWNRRHSPRMRPVFRTRTPTST